VRSEGGWERRHEAKREPGPPSLPSALERHGVLLVLGSYITALSRLWLQDDYQWVSHSLEHLLNNPTWCTEWRQVW
jgi:hypothetical protein